MLGRLIAVLLVAVPLLEIAVFILIGQRSGVLPTLLGVLLSTAIGALVLRWQGISALRQVQATVNRGELPGRQVADAMLVGVGAALMIVPGYLTTLSGLLLVLPPVRGLIYRALVWCFWVVG